MTRVVSTIAGRRNLAFYFLAGSMVLFGLLSGLPRCFSQDLPEALQNEFREGVAAQKAGHWDEAEKVYRQVLRRGGKAAFVYNNLGIVYQQMGDQEQAIAQFREAVRLKADYVAPRILLGASLLATGQVAIAARELEVAVRLQPRERLARLQLAKAYERSGDSAGVVEQFRALRELAPQEPEYAYQLGRAYLSEAEWSIKEIKRLNPRSARLFQILAESYDARGRAEEAIEAFQRASQIDPKLPGIHLELAWIYLKQGKKALARQEIERELAIVPESIEARSLQKRLTTSKLAVPQIP